MSVLLAVFMFALWSSVFSLGKIALYSSPPLFLTGFRMLAGGLILLLFLFLFKRSQLRFSKKSLLTFLLLALLSIYLSNILEFWGLQHLSAAKTCFLYSLSPFFAALLSFLHFQEKMNLRKWIGLGIGFLGFLPVLAAQSGAEELLNFVSFLSWPSLAVIGAAFASVYGWVLLRLIVKDRETSPLLANGVSMVLGGALALLHSLAVESWTPFPIAPSETLPFLKAVGSIILISNLICYNLYGLALKRFTATFLSFLGLLSPLFASLHEWLLLGTPPSWTLLLSVGVVSLGLGIVYQAELKQGYIADGARSRKEKVTP